jgi:membrane peptidoglycan carboxypeptidase
VLEVGADKVVEAAHRMGITAPLEAYPSIALGTEEVSPLDLATGYTTIASGGYRIPPSPVKKITNAEGKVLFEAKPKKKRVLSQPVAALATEALTEVMKTGTGRRLQLGRPAAGKTGTSEEYSDAWFAGFTPQMVGVSWVGFPRSRVSMRPPRTRIRVFGSSWPGQMWHEFMLEAHKGLPEQDFPKAEELLVKVRVDSLRNCLPNEYTPEHLIKVKSYMKGAEPKEKCTEPKSPTIEDTPDVVGKSASEARGILERAGFTVVSASQYCPAFREGRVCDQTPESGTRSTVGTRATIFVSNDQAITEVPMVLGRTLERAREKLTEAGYRVRVVHRQNSDSYSGCRDIFEEEEGRVWAQNPCSGANYGRGSTVTIYVNS